MCLLRRSSGGKSSWCSAVKIASSYGLTCCETKPLWHEQCFAGNIKTKKNQLWWVVKKWEGKTKGHKTPMANGRIFVKSMGTFGGCYTIPETKTVYIPSENRPSQRKFIFQLSTIHFQVQSVDFREDISGFWFLYPHHFSNNHNKTTKFWQPTLCTLAVKSTKFITPKPFFQGPKNRPCLKVCWIVNQDVQVTWFLQIQTRRTHTTKWSYENCKLQNASNHYSIYKNHLLRGVKNMPTCGKAEWETSTP